MSSRGTGAVPTTASRQQAAAILPWLIALALTPLIISALGCGGESGSGDTTTFTVPSPSMEPTFSPGDEVSVDLDAYKHSQPAIGDAVVLHPPLGATRGRQCGVPHPPKASCPKPTPGSSSQLFLKRVVALPGDRVRVLHGHPVVNGMPMLTDVIQSCNGLGTCNLPRAITIPPGYFFVMGDNSEGSLDSRHWGPVTLHAIVGKVSE